MSMKSFLRIVPLALTLGLLAAPTAAQVGIIPGSGCPGAAAVASRGTPSIGNPMQFAWQCDRAELPIMWFGRPHNRSFTLNPPVVCGRSPCELSVNPDVFVAGVTGSPLTVTTAIPLDRSLVGVVVGVQAGCVVPGNGRVPCLTLSQALAVRIMR